MSVMGQRKWTQAELAQFGERFRQWQTYEQGNKGALTSDQIAAELGMSKDKMYEFDDDGWRYLSKKEREELRGKGGDDQVRLAKAEDEIVALHRRHNTLVQQVLQLEAIVEELRRSSTDVA